MIWGPAEEMSNMSNKILINPADYEAPSAAARRLGVTRAYICRLAAAGRIAGAFRTGAEGDDPRGRSWFIPKSWAGLGDKVKGAGNGGN